MNRTQRTKTPRGKSIIVKSYQRLRDQNNEAQANMKKAEQKLYEATHTRKAMDIEDIEPIPTPAQKGAATKAVKAAQLAYDIAVHAAKETEARVNEYTSNLNRKQNKKIRLHA